MRNLSRAHGKTAKRWFGPYTIVKIHDKELCSLKNKSDGKIHHASGSMTQESCGVRKVSAVVFQQDSHPPLNKAIIITATIKLPLAGKPEIWLAIAELELDYELRRTLLSDRGWLDDNVINAAQSQLKDQYVGLEESTAIVNVYDSYTSLSTSTKEQICALLFTMNSSKDVRFIDSDKQANTSA
eukprot:Em0001g545a